MGGSSVKVRLVEENQIQKVVSAMAAKGFSLDDLYREISECYIVDLDIMSKVVQDSSYSNSTDKSQFEQKPTSYLGSKITGMSGELLKLFPFEIRYVDRSQQ